MKIKHLNIALLALLTASCADEVTPTSQNDFLEGNEKTPVKVSALLDVQKAQTRAADKTFDNNDKLIAYFRHVTWNGANDGARTLVEADKSPLLVTFTKGSTAMAAYSGSDITPIGTGVALGMTSTNTQEASDLTADPTLYWDDFSNSASAATDLRTTGHYLQSYYGYCYNGGEPTTALVPADGTLGWTVETDQTSGIKTSDLLWSAEQTPVKYSHETTRDGLILPYTHAMSKVTIEVICKDGFESKESNFSAAGIKLNEVNTAVSCDAPKAELSSFGTSTTVTMQKGTVATDKKSCSFTALIAPTVFVKDKKLATISGIDGNTYTLKLSDEVLKTAASTDDKAWSTQLAASNTTKVSYCTEAGYTTTDGGLTKPGVNYYIQVTINKQEITVKATILDWDEVTATGVGEINFTNDITDKTGEIATALQDKGFDLYQAAEADPAVYGSAVTTYTYDKTTDPDNPIWTRTNDIYWPNGTDKFYFRALSPKTSTTAMANGSDVLWGTTAAYTWGTDNVAEGGLVAPRTGDVPLTFDHPMTKVTFILQNDPDAEESKKVNLDGAKIQLTNLISKGTLDLHEGSITLSTAEADKLAELFSGGLSTTYNSETKKATTEYQILIPQDIPNDSRIQITLADGTKYSAQLNQCVVENSTSYVNTWVRNTHYTYVITVGKEKIKFRALLKDWDEKEASGNATLDWDD